MTLHRPGAASPGATRPPLRHLGLALLVLPLFACASGNKATAAAPPLEADHPMVKQSFAVFGELAALMESQADNCIATADSIHGWVDTNAYRVTPLYTWRDGLSEEDLERLDGYLSPLDQRFERATVSCPDDPGIENALNRLGSPPHYRAPDEDNRMFEIVLALHKDLARSLESVDCDGVAPAVDAWILRNEGSSARLAAWFESGRGQKVIEERFWEDQAIATIAGVFAECDGHSGAQQAAAQLGM